MDVPACLGKDGPAWHDIMSHVSVAELDEKGRVRRRVQLCVRAGSVNVG